MLKNRKSNKISCLNCFVSHLCLGRNIPTDELTTLDGAISHVKEVKKGENVYWANDEMSAIYSVYMGSCKQYLLDEKGCERIENFYLPGDLISLESMPNGKHHYSLMALEDSTLCVIPMDTLVAQMQASLDFTKRFLAICSYKMQNDKQIATATNATQRVADLLLNIYYRLEERKLNQESIVLPMSQLDISNFLGMAHETVNRVLRKFHNEKIMTINNKQIRINNIQELKQIGSCYHHTGQDHD